MSMLEEAARRASIESRTLVLEPLLDVSANTALRHLNNMNQISI